MVFLISNLERIRAESASSARIASRISASPAASSGSAASKRSAASGAPVSIAVPDGSTNESERTVEYESFVVPQRIPPELLATTPPTVAKSVDAGSGPSLRPSGISTRFTCPSVVPGRTRTVSPSPSTSMPVQWRRTSTMIPSPWPWPFRLVPAARSVTGIPCAAAVVEDARDLGGVARGDDDLGKAAVGARVGGVADDVDRAREDPVGAKQALEVAAQRLRRAGGKLLRRLVRRRACRRRRDPLYLGGAQPRRRH